MEKFSLDKEWRFHKGEIASSPIHTHTECYMAAKAGGAAGAADPNYDRSDWEIVNLPHDYAVENEFDEKYGPASGYKARGKAWYAKNFTLPETMRGKRLTINFGGVTSVCTVYMNGSVVGRNFSAYNSFAVDITDVALFGSSFNSLVIQVDADVIEGWWYEGAGIYRHVDLIVSPLLSVAHNGIFVHPKKLNNGLWNVIAETTVQNDTDSDAEFTVKSFITDADGKPAGAESADFIAEAYESAVVTQNILSRSPRLWDIDDPYMYTLKTELYSNGELAETIYTPFGFRTIEIDKDNGFFLNGRHVLLRGTCNHQDHAGVGVAVPDSINEYRIRLLKEMGSNAYRCAHGNPTPEILDYCDKYGLLVMDENRWFNTSEDCLNQLRSMVKRDRNHPSVIMYSLFNEEPLQGTPTGRRLARHMQSEVKKLDNTRFTLGAMNNGVTSEDGACDILDITGFNYITHTYDEFREKYPDMPMLGSENDSAFQTRGVYKTDREKHIIDCYDSEAAPWGNTYRDGFKQVDTREHIMGLFIWTGFDYRGEPTPFEWPSISTQFGIMDTCGFKKDAFYLNKAYFTSEPMIHVLPHWNHKVGDTVRVMAHTNCEDAELFLNGESLGKKPVDKYDMCDWQVEFVPGILELAGYKDGTEVCRDSVKTAGNAAKLKLEPHKDELYGGRADACAIAVSAEDENGNFVPTAQNLIKFECAGGRIIGVGNGDPNSHESDKLPQRHLFNGLCQVIIEPDDGAESVTLKASADGLQSREISIPVKNGREKRYIPSINEKYVSVWRTNVELFAEKPRYDIVIEDHDMNNWTVARAGGGYDERFDGKTGYALYRTTVSVTPTDKTLEF
ncbi:MAG: DUF4982 domain-containing protein, partial [Firmicutes bacterium]|nr:DUF4982 domain-containing protein [Bacillota bacterium]